MHDLESLLDNLGRPRLLVLGDLMVDRFVWGEAERISPEAAALVLRCDREEARPGGAAGVALLAAALGADVRVAGVVGLDEGGAVLRHLLREAGISRRGIVCDPNRPTTVKQRFVGQVGNGPRQQLLRLDRETQQLLGGELRGRLLQLIESNLEECHALLVADHGKGVCSHELLAGVFAAAARLGIPVLVDPARGGCFGPYRGAELLLPNRREAIAALGQAIDSVEDAVFAARTLSTWIDVPAVLLKLDGDGMVLTVKKEPERVYPARGRVVLDVTGAGDTVLAVMGLCRACGVDWHRAAELASVAAGVQVGWPGSAPISRAELLCALTPCGKSAGKVVSLERLAELAEGYRKQKRRMVLTNGCFDVMHAGHSGYLEQAASLGDILVVAVNDDASVRRLKGEGRPVIGQSDRASLLAALGCVDHVLVFSGDTPHEVLRRVRPDVLVKGGDYSVAEVVGQEVVQSYGGRVVVTDKVDGFSTSKLLAAVRKQSA